MCLRYAVLQTANLLTDTDALIPGQYIGINHIRKFEQNNFIGWVDHDAIEHWFGITIIALKWFQYYLPSLCLCTASSLTRQTLEGPVMGPLLFALYTVPLGSLLAQQVLDTTIMPTILESSSALTTLLLEIASDYHYCLACLNLCNSEWPIINYSSVHLKQIFCCWKRHRNAKI